MKEDKPLNEVTLFGTNYDGALDEEEDNEYFECEYCGSINECWCEYYENDMDERFAP